jgi:hypothetical protein
MELHEFHVGENGACPCSKRDTLTEVSDGIGRRTIEATDPAGREHHSRRRQDNGTLCRRAKQAGDPLVVQENPPGFEAFKHGNGRRSGDCINQRADDRSTGTIAFGVDDTAAGMRGFETERELPRSIPVEAHARTLQGRDRCRCIGDDASRDIRITEPIASLKRIGKMQFGTIVRPEAGGYAALCPGA